MRDLFATQQHIVLSIYGSQANNRSQAAVYMNRAAASLLLEYFLLLEYSLLYISGCKLPFQVAVFATDELLEFMETWGFAISFATCQPGNRSEYIHIEGVIVQGPYPSGSRYANPPPLLRHWQFVLKYFRY